MASVAVCAGATEPGPPVLNVHLLVAFVALQNRFHDWLVRVVARFAGQRCVHREPGIALRLERSVAARAVPTPKDVGLRLEDMAGVAIHWHAIEIDVRKSSLVLVALCADSSIGSVEGELGRVVAVVALHFFLNHHVCVVPRCKTDLRPTFGHRSWRRRVSGCLDLLNVAFESAGQEPGNKAKHREHHHRD